MDMVNTCKSFGCVGENFKRNLHACELRNALPQLYIAYLHVFPIGTDAEPNCPESASDIAGINLFTTKLNCIDIDIRLQQKNGVTLALVAVKI